MKTYSIYRITNLTNGKVYIGFTSQTPSARWVQHKSSARNGSEQPIHLAIRKHGEAAFVFDIIYQSWEDVHTLDVIEPQFIQEYDSIAPNGYNVSLGGSAPTLGLTISEDHKAAIAKAHRGKVNSTETRAKMSASKRGQPKTEEHRAKLAAASALREVHVCPHCLKSGKGSQMFRWHFDRCGQRAHSADHN